LIQVLLVIVLWLLVHPTVGSALAPDEIVVVANVRARDSLDLARYYMQQRHIPADHLIQIATPWDEHISRKEYDKDIRNPVRAALDRLGTNSRIRCLVTMYGVPLAIRPLNPEEDEEVLQLTRTLEMLNRELERASEKRLAALRKEKKQVEQSLAARRKMDSRAAVDSELALVLVDEYPLDGWLANPYFLGFSQQETRLDRDSVLMVSRLDGPDPPTVRRLVDDALFAEKKGLHGQAYFDARWAGPKQKKLSGYALYDASLHAAADGIRNTGRMAVQLDARDELFQPGECPNAALYSGWYSLGHYVDAFVWVRGAIGYHIASSECTTLKETGSQVWCKRMLEEGVAATIGPVYEPYVQAFPLPDLFFLTLAEGYLSLGETYLVSLPYLSWQMVLIGDPLYMPFAPQ
jgi:uncharacterized protein (TIGR03790 family)